MAKTDGPAPAGLARHGDRSRPPAAARLRLPLPPRLPARRGVTGTALAIGAGAASSASSAPGGFPGYTYVRTLLRPEALAYNPTGEIIFPCVRGTVGRISSALGRYYLYYAPHDAPGGICLACSDSLEGPFTEHPDNPGRDRPRARQAARAGGGPSEAAPPLSRRRGLGLGQMRTPAWKLPMVFIDS